ncbi:MAG: hypothetical protein M3R69_11755 [Acidobacteriota bacterium]|nr:hypothetical protein [Acidobacteriota bacterium]
MNILDQTRFIERQQFFNGQRLFADDLQSLEAFNREMRWLHNKSLHQPGIGNGFAVSGKKGDREVTIGPGYAIDREGHEIVLIRDQVEPVPPTAGEPDGSPTLYDLTVSYLDEELEEAERREGICNQRGAVRLREAPVFCWVRLDSNGQPQETREKQEILSGMRLVLARAEVLNCKLYQNLSVAERLNARPATLPYICCGTSELAWQPLMFAPINPAETFSSEDGADLVRSFSLGGFFPFVLPIGLAATVDTSVCGFLNTPCYSARITGPRFRRFARTIQLDGVATTANIDFVLEGFVQIVDPKPKSFIANILLMGQLIAPNVAQRAAMFEVAGNAINFLSTTNLESDTFKAQLQDAVDNLFGYSRNESTGEETGWRLVWMGVED